MSVGLFMNDVVVVALTGGTTIERHDIVLRIFRNILSQPIGDIETDVAKAVTDLGNDLAGAFRLGGEVRGIDFGGMHGSPLTTDWGHLEVSGNRYRIADMAIGLIVDDSSTLAA